MAKKTSVDIFKNVYPLETRQAPITVLAIDKLGKVTEKVISLNMDEIIETGEGVYKCNLYQKDGKTILEYALTNNWIQGDNAYFYAELKGVDANNKHLRVDTPLIQISYGVAKAGILELDTTDAVEAVVMPCDNTGMSADYLKVSKQTAPKTTEFRFTSVKKSQFVNQSGLTEGYLDAVASFRSHVPISHVVIKDSFDPFIHFVEDSFKTYDEDDAASPWYVGTASFSVYGTKCRPGNHTITATFYDEHGGIADEITTTINVPLNIYDLKIEEVNAINAQQMVHTRFTVYGDISFVDASEIPVKIYIQGSDYPTKTLLKSYDYREMKDIFDVDITGIKELAYDDNKLIIEVLDKDGTLLKSATSANIPVERVGIPDYGNCNGTVRIVQPVNPYLVACEFKVNSTVGAFDGVGAYPVVNGEVQVGTPKTIAATTSYTWQDICMYGNGNPSNIGEYEAIIYQGSKMVGRCKLTQI